MKYKYTLKNSDHKDFEKFKINIYCTKDDFAGMSASVLTCKKEHGTTLSETCDRVYYVLKGKGKFMIGNEAIDVVATDMIIIPKNTMYNFFGKIKVLLINSPAFDREAEKKF